MPGGKGNIKPGDNPKPFKKGQSGNPKGRPPKTVTEILKDLGEAKAISYSLEITGQDGKTKTIKAEIDSDKNINEAVAAVLLKKALGGDLKAIQEVLDRTEGKPKQTIDQKTDITGISVNVQVVE